MTRSPSPERAADPSTLAALAGALGHHLTDDLSPWVLVAGSVDREVRGLFAHARVVMWDGASSVRLPRESFQLGLWFAEGTLLDAGLETMVKVRNALARDAVLFVVAGRDRLATVRELAETAGLSRVDISTLTSSIGVIELRR